MEYIKLYIYFFMNISYSQWTYWRTSPPLHCRPAVREPLPAGIGWRQSDTLDNLPLHCSATRDGHTSGDSSTTSHSCSGAAEGSRREPMPCSDNTGTTHKGNITFSMWGVYRKIRDTKCFILQYISPSKVWLHSLMLSNIPLFKHSFTSHY